MSVSMPTSCELIDGLVRHYFRMEPEVLAAVAHDDEEVRLRREPDTSPTADPLDGLEVLTRRVLALCVALRNHPGAVALVTERQAVAAGWPDVRLANWAIVAAWALSLLMPSLAVPLLIEADEDAGDAMMRLIRVDGGRLPGLRALNTELRRCDGIDVAAMDRAVEARERAPDRKNLTIVSLRQWLIDWLGVDADAIALPIDWRVPRLEGREARAVACVAWLVDIATDLGATMEREEVEAVRLKTDRDAALAGEPGADLANCALLLGAAMRHGAGFTPHVLPPREQFADALEEAGRRIAQRRAREGDDPEVRTVDMYELQDVAARGYVHVGRQNIRRVAWKQIHAGG